MGTLSQSRRKLGSTTNDGEFGKPMCSASDTSIYSLHAVSGALMAFTIIFTHTFAFGLIARAKHYKSDRVGSGDESTCSYTPCGGSLRG